MILIAMGLAVIAVPAVGEELGARQQPPVCGPRHARTLMTNGAARVFDRWVTRSFRSQEGLFGCVSGSKPKRLDRPRSDGLRPWLSLGLFALNAPWVAYRENFVEIDVGDLEVAIVNLRTGRSRHCFIGRWSAAGSGWLAMTNLVVSESGTAAWIGKREEPEGWGREVASCEGTDVEQLDSGPGIALKSLRLEGSTLRWTNAGVPRSALLG